MDIIGLLKAALEVVGTVLRRKWGEQTASEASLRAQAEVAASKKHEALAKLKEAQDHGDDDAARQYLSAVNGWAAELRRLSEQAAAEHES